MNHTVKNLYELSLKDEEYINEINSAEKKNIVPGFLSSDVDKMIFVTYYWGWLVGKGKDVHRIAESCRR